MRRAVIDPRLSARIVSERPLRYTTSPRPDDDRPDHVRAASGLAVLGDSLFVIQDDAAFIAVINGDEVDAIALPSGPSGRRRFELALGNKLAKLDLEACLVDAGELLAFGSGSLPIREQICQLRDTSARSPSVVIIDAAALYASARAAVGGVLNVEGAARIRDELWLFHRGNTGPDDPGPTVVRYVFAEFRAYLAGAPAPRVRAVDRYDLGTVQRPGAGGAAAENPITRSRIALGFPDATAPIALGFTDATSHEGRVVFVCAAEASEDAIADGAVLGSQLGVIDDAGVRTTPLVGRNGQLLKVEGIAIVPGQRDRAWLTLDPDDPDLPAPLCEVALHGPWW